MLDPKCTAINYNKKKGGCTLRACPLPVPSPKGKRKDFEGYYKKLKGTKVIENML